MCRFYLLFRCAGSDEKLFLEPIKKIEGTVVLPGSKSMSNRILLLSALAKGKTKVLNLLDSDDIRYMVRYQETPVIQQKKTLRRAIDERGKRLKPEHLPRCFSCVFCFLSFGRRDWFRQ